jgi:hypothetical protein
VQVFGFLIIRNRYGILVAKFVRRRRSYKNNIKIELRRYCGKFVQMFKKCEAGCGIGNCAHFGSPLPAF